MKHLILSVLIVMALLCSNFVMSDDVQDSPFSGLFPEQPTTPDNPDFEPSLFIADTFALILDPTFFSDFKDEQIQEIPADAFGGFTLEQFTELPTDVFDSFSPMQFENLLPELLADINSERFELLTPEVVANLTSDQIGFLPRAAIAGMTDEQFNEARGGDFLKSLLSGNMGGLPPEVIEDFDTSDFEQLDEEQCLQMLPQDLAKLFTNLNPDNFQPTDITKCLPEDWALDGDTGALEPPANSLIILDIIPRPEDFPDNLKIPDIFNMDSGLAVAGRSGKGKALDGLNDILKKLGLDGQFVFEQQDISGILRLAGMAEFEGAEFAFIPDPRNAEFLGPDDPDVAAGLSLDPTNGAIRFITEAGLRLPLLPMPSDPMKMLEALADQGVEGVVEIADNGVITVPDLPGQSHPLAFMIDLMVTSDPGFGPGLHRNPQGDGFHYLVDAIGNTQRIHPTLPEPAELVSWGELFDVVIQHKINGSFSVLLEGMEYTLKPTFDVETRTLAEDEEVAPGVGTDSNGKLAFVTTQDEKTVVTIRLMLIDPQGNELDL